jgi:Domain of unknown function (DUF4331)
MKARVWLGALGVAAAAAGLAIKLHAADHADGPAVMAEPAGDITDVYAWMSADKTKVNLVMDVYPNAPASSMMSDQVLYVFHLNSSASYGAAATETKIICGFNVAQAITCWVGSSESVTGNASATTGIMSASGKTKVFAGLRDDPFFFNLTGFKATTADVVAAAAGTPPLTFDTSGCPALDAATSTALVTQLKTGTAGAAPTNNFAGQNVQSIVIQVDTTLVTPGGKILGVWGSTHSRA